MQVAWYARDRSTTSDKQYLTYGLEVVRYHSIISQHLAWWMSNGWALDEASTGDTNSRFGCTSSIEIYLWPKTYIFLSHIAVGSSNHLIFLPMRKCQSSWFSSRVASIFPICSPYQTTMRNLIRDGKILARIRMSRGCRKVSGGIQHNAVPLFQLVQSSNEATAGTEVTKSSPPQDLIGIEVSIAKSQPS